MTNTNEIAYRAYSQEWAQAFCNQINESKSYEDAARGWEGTVSLVVLAEPDKNFKNDVGVWMDLWHGKARDVHICNREEATEAAFVLTGSYSRWKKIAKKELDPIKGLMMGQIKLKGNFPTIVRYTKASQELVECTTSVPVIWPDEEI